MLSGSPPVPGALELGVAAQRGLGAAWGLPEVVERAVSVGAAAPAMLALGGMACRLAARVEAPSVPVARQAVVREPPAVAPSLFLRLAEPAQRQAVRPVRAMRSLRIASR